MNEYSKIEKLIYSDKNYDDALNMIASSENAFSQKYVQLKAEALFNKNDFENAMQIYNKLGDYYKVGYCYFLLKEIDLSIKYFLMAQNSPAKSWSLFLAEIFRARVNSEVTYLQVRAFLEKDLNTFLRLKLDSYVQKIIDLSDYFEGINPETNKYIARAFLFNDYPNYAKVYLDRAFDITTKDAELYYLLAKYYKTQGQIDKVKENLKEALRLLDNYLPAKLMLEEIS